MILKIVPKASHEYTPEKVDYEREGKPEKKFDAAFGGTIFRISMFSKKQAETLIFFFSLTRQAKNLKKTFTHVQKELSNCIGLQKIGFYLVTLRSQKM